MGITALLLYYHDYPFYVSQERNCLILVLPSRSTLVRLFIAEDVDSFYAVLFL